MDRRSAKPKQEKEGVNRCLMFIGLLLLVTNIALVCVGGVYITHMQGQIDELRQQYLQLNSQGDVKIEPRVRRGVHFAEEPAHVRKHHHGIASANIALIHGDPDKIPIDSNGTDVDGQQWNSSAQQMGHCKSMYKRGDNDMFCKPVRPGLKPLYFFYGYNKRYQYFQKAEWMYTSKSQENFQLTPDGSLTVKKSGLYIVHASVTFFCKVTTTAYYGVYRTNPLNKSTQSIASCISPRIDGLGLQVAPCQVWQLVHLNAGDEVHMAIGGYVWFRVEKDTLHLALIRLNNSFLQ